MEQLTVKDWIYIVGIAIVVIIAIIGAILGVIQKLKRKAASGEAVTVGDVINESKNALTDLLLNDLPQYIAEAESLNVAGAMKKLIVMSKASLKCAETGLDYQSNSNTISEKVDDLVDLTNKVNTNKSTNSVIEVK